MKKIRQWYQMENQSAKLNLDRVYPGIKLLRLILGGALACGFATLLACSTTPVKPLDIAQGDVCFRCKTPISEAQYAAEFVTKDGFVRKFDDIACMIQHAQGKVGKGNIKAYFTVDLDTKQWMKADEAAYVHSDKFKTPMNGGILAFKNKAKAQTIASSYQAELLSFDQILK